MKNETFRKIVSTSNYSCIAKQLIPNPEVKPDPDEHYYSIDSDDEYKDRDEKRFYTRYY